MRTLEKIDLHMHSDISLDGQFNPGELAALCRKAGLNTVSLTDHNSVRGVDEMMLSARLGVKQTFGSDFHGKNKPAVRLGMTGAPPDAGDADWLFQKGGN